MAEPMITVDGLAAHAGAAPIVHDVSFSVGAGEVVTLFGPSGAGKTTVAMAVAGLAIPGVSTSGRVTVSRSRSVVGYLPQQAAETLNPARRIGRALDELVALRKPGEGKVGRRRKVVELLRSVAFDGDDAEIGAVLRRYPFEFSGGQRTRLALAQVLATEPGAIVLDEPTTGLDALSRATLVDQLGMLAGTGVAILLVTQDPVVVRRLGHRVLRVHDGTVSEAGEDLPLAEPLARAPVVARGDPVVELAGVSVRYGRTTVLCDVDVTLFRGETLGVAGVSGAGKSTIARCIAGLARPTRGRVLADGEPLPSLRGRTKSQIARVQYVWQEAASSFDPRRTVVDQVAATGILLRGLDAGRSRAEALRELADLGVTEAQARRYPPGLSGGQLQRAAVARALLARPHVLICDEVTTGLDPPLSARILDHIDGYQRRTDASVIQISHDLRTLLGRADRILTVDGGRIVGAATPQQPARAASSAMLARLSESDPV